MTEIQIFIIGALFAMGLMAMGILYNEYENQKKPVVRKREHYFITLTEKELTK